MDTLTAKRCPRCGLEKAPADYNRNGTSPDGLQSYCRKCHNEQNRRNTILRDFGISKEEYETFKAGRTGSCEICGRVYKHMHVDHSHTTGKLRGLLCGPCNQGLGFFYDKSEILMKAAAYLDSHWVSMAEPPFTSCRARHGLE